MKTYFINGRFDGCYYVRQYLPMYHNGWDGNKTSMYTPQVNNHKAFQGAMNADVIVFHRPDQEEKKEVIPLLRAAGKKVVVDNDDTYLPDSGVPVESLYSNKDLLDKVNRNIIESVKNAHMATVSTKFLAEEYKHYNDNVVILPNCVDPDDWGPVEYQKNEKIRVGLVGSVVITNDYEDITDILKWLSDDPRYQLVVLGLPPNDPKYEKMREIYKKEIEFWNSLDIEWHPFVDADEYIDKLKSLHLDIALIPRAENYFNKCKSNLKFLEMSMCGVPCITSGWKDNPYESDRKYIYMPNTPQGWKRAINTLSDGKTRRDRGMSARIYVQSKYDIKKKAHLWKKAYQSLMN